VISQFLRTERLGLKFARYSLLLFLYLDPLRGYWNIFSQDFSRIAISSLPVDIPTSLHRRSAQFRRDVTTFFPEEARISAKDCLLLSPLARKVTSLLIIPFFYRDVPSCVERDKSSFVRAFLQRTHEKFSSRNFFQLLEVPAAQTVGSVSSLFPPPDTPPLPQEKIFPRAGFPR